MEIDFWFIKFGSEQMEQMAKLQTECDAQGEKLIQVANEAGRMFRSTVKKLFMVHRGLD